MKKWILAPAVLLTAVTACSFSHIQAATAPAQSTAKPAQQSTLRSAHDGIAVIGSNGPVVGVNLYALHDYTAAQTTADGVRTLSYIKNTLHANAVDLVWNMYVPGYYANSVVTDKSTLSAANIGILTKIARQDGLFVEYRPLLFVQTSGNTWEGLLEPSNPAQWFDSYYAKNLPYLRMAQRYHVNEYVIGTEMNRLTPAEQWASFLARCAEVFKGEISYAQNQHFYFPPLTQLPPTELTGVDMYEPLNLPASAPLSEVVAAFEAFFAKVPASLLRKTAIQETGIESRAGAYSDPPNLQLTGNLDQAVQFNWFTAACETVKRFHMRGVFFWKVDLSDKPLTHPASSLSTFEGKEGAVAISRCEDIVKG
jgi:hypothetical protein